MKTLWKSFKKGFTSYNDFKWKLNKWEHQEGKIIKCKNGFHASTRIINAMQFVNCEELGLVEVKGQCDKEKDKECWSDMRLIKKYKWTKKDSVKLSIFAAELSLENFEKLYPEDNRPREAIEAAKKWLKNPTEKNRSAAELAARSAARSAAESEASAAESEARSARSAAWSAWSAELAAESAAESEASAAESEALAARSAVRSAVRSAESEAESEKILDKCEEYIKKEILKIK